VNKQKLIQLFECRPSSVNTQEFSGIVGYVDILPHENQPYLRRHACLNVPQLHFNTP